MLVPASDLLFPKTGQRGTLLSAVDAAADQQNWSSDEFRTIRERFATGQRFPGMEFMLPLLYGGREGLQTLFDYLPPETSLIIHDPLAVKQRMRLVRDRIQANYLEAIERHSGSPAPG